MQTRCPPCNNACDQGRTCPARPERDLWALLGHWIGGLAARRPGLGALAVPRDRPPRPPAPPG